MRCSSSLTVILKKDANPHCAHGPTTLFEEYRNGAVRKFFACSAFRDRKDCSFYQLFDSEKKNNFIAADERFACIPNKTNCKDRLEQIKRMKSDERTLCTSCGLLLLKNERHDHQSHLSIQTLPPSFLQRPTKSFLAIDCSKSFAQYWFTTETVKFIVDTLMQLGYVRFLCIGAPRLHEHILMSNVGQKVSPRSLLLDLDKRYQQVWPDDSFCHYNLFNHHFFNEDDHEVFDAFVRNDVGPLVIILDPPFGGLVEVIANTLRRISTKCSGEVATVWVFPLFLEPQLQQVCPSLKMSDYMVDYDNHSLFRSGGRKYGSPIRIFTDISPEKFVLPSDLGYWFCKPCKAYRYPNNWHCKKCGTCTSKDGSRYVHCDRCQGCVKPSRRHCHVCNLCLPPDHICGQTLSPGCHICGDMTHKRRDCPVKQTGIKRKLTHALKRPKTTKRKKIQR